jgi:hypothetical protein
MAHEVDNFLSRWARRKRESANAAPASAPQPAPPLAQLPPIDALSFESDFQPFMHAKVDARLRRLALKKLFSDPRFNVMDGLDTYIDDYTKEDPIPPGMLAQLQHARSTLFGPSIEEEKAPGGDPPLLQAQPAEEPGNADRRPAEEDAEFNAGT